MALSRDSTRILGRTEAAVVPLLRSRVASLPPQSRDACGAHFGWSSEEGAAVGAPSGSKFVRAALALLGCQAVHGDAEAALPAAVAVELVHNASLLHDDIIDRDTVRRGRRALWAVKGVPAAILAGDALFFAAVQALTGTRRCERSIPVLLASVQTLIEGEYIDILLESATDTGEEQVVAVAAAKTGELLACACELGAIAGGAEPERAAHLRAFGCHLGIAFQCADDMLGIWGSPESTGKPTGSDLRRRKMSLPVTAAMAGPDPQAGELRALYRRGGELNDEECVRAVELIEEGGGRQAAARRVRLHTDHALRHLGTAAPAPGPAEELAALADHLVHRER